MAEFLGVSDPSAHQWRPGPYVDRLARPISYGKAFKVVVGSKLEKRLGLFLSSAAKIYFPASTTRHITHATSSSHKKKSIAKKNWRIHQILLFFSFEGHQGESVPHLNFICFILVVCIMYGRTESGSIYTVANCTGIWHSSVG